MSVDSVRYPGHDAGLERQEENSMKVNTVSPRNAGEHCQQRVVAVISVTVVSVPCQLCLAS